MSSTALVVASVAVTSTARADFLGHDRLRAHVAALDIAGTTETELDTGRVPFVLSALVPGLGTYRLEKVVFGEVRPAGIVGDWVVGGLVPAALGVGALVADDRDTRAALAWSALGIYAGTRLAIFVIGNLHISEYRRALHLRCAATAQTAGLAIAW